MTMRVVFIAGYNHPSQHRKVELLADEPDIELVHMAGKECGRAPGRHPSADGKHSYTLLTGRVISLGRPGDPHRSLGWPPPLVIGRLKPDLIHYEGEVESLGAAEIVLCRALLAPRAALVLTSWQNILRTRSLLVRLISNFNLAAARHVLCASQEAVAVLRQQGYRGGASVLPIMGVDRRYFYPQHVVESDQPAAVAHSQPAFVVGYLGRLVPEKGIGDLLRAAAMLARPVQVRIIGAGPAAAPLRQLADELGLGMRCQFVGPVAYDDLAGHLNRLDVLVLPSHTTPHWKEQFGRVLIEALACGVPVVGASSGAIPEVIGDERCIFPEGDVAALAALLDRLAADVPMRHSLAQAGYQRTLARFSVEQLARDTLAVWRVLLG